MAKWGSRAYAIFSCPRFRRAVAVLGAVAAVVSLASPQLRAQGGKKPLEKREVIELLKGDVPSARVAEIVRGRGVSFEMTAETENELRDAGATEELIKTLRQLAPKPAAGPVLLIEATPGGAQVYVDDEPVGTTSPEGRLKLPSLAPGSHRVRLALAGYLDHEETVNLTSGETTVTASLQAAQSPSSASSPPASTSTSTSSDTPSLGVLLNPNPPAGTRGVYISVVTPGGPADQAGLRPGYSILSIEGRPVNNLQQAQQVLNSLQPGIVANVTYWNGSSTQTRGIKLVPRSSLYGSSQTSSGPVNQSGTTASGGGTVSFPVVHDHGPPAPNYCVGIMTIGNGRIVYHSSNGVHNFVIPLSMVKEAKKNAIYLAAYGGFHIRLKKGTVYNFAVINPQGQFQPPDALLTAIDQAMGR